MTRPAGHALLALFAVLAGPLVPDHDAVGDLELVRERNTLRGNDLKRSAWGCACGLP